MGYDIESMYLLRFSHLYQNAQLFSLSHFSLINVFFYIFFQLLSTVLSEKRKKMQWARHLHRQLSAIKGPLSLLLYIPWNMLHLVWLSTRSPLEFYPIGCLYKILNDFMRLFCGHWVTFKIKMFNSSEKFLQKLIKNIFGHIKHGLTMISYF